MNATSQTYEFTLVLSSVTELTDALADALFEAGCDDGTLGEQGGVVFLDFSREGDSPRAAILSAIAAVEGAGVGARVARVEPDDLVTLAEIARRSGRSRAGVRLLISGERGPGGFPLPVVNLTRQSPLWSWTEVSNWLAGNMPPARERPPEQGVASGDLAESIAAINAALDLRRHTRTGTEVAQLCKAIARNGR